jgi:DNA-binding response OmpR family regulator
MLFVKNQNKLLSQEYIYDEIWERDMISDNTSVRRTVNRLQAKLKNSGYMITNKYGKGYCFGKIVAESESEKIPKIELRQK